ncbi:SCO family protein [Pseudoalteromonas sp. T1lg65]|uniref:SCO family protein n=1 Tax=Pseudoalteromonas sp. T1lg65 TaxID=2077101 RepID=UPI003F7B2BE0
MNRLIHTSVFIAIATGLGLLLVLLVPKLGQTKTVEWLSTPKQLSTFSLVSASGTISEASMRKQWHVVVFGYLNCPDICPTSMLELTNLAYLLEQQKLSDQIQIVFVSVDPSRDKLSELDQYVKHFNPEFLGVTGDEKQLTKLADSLGVQFKVLPSEEDYNVTHSTTFSLISPDGKLAGRFRSGFSAVELSQDLSTRILLEAHRS